MPTRLVHVVADAQDPARLARFWAALLGWEVADETVDEVDVWPAGYTYPDPVAVPIVFVPVPERKTGKNRVLLDLVVDHLDAATTEVEGLGGRSLEPDITRELEDFRWRCMADPKGNEFDLDVLPGDSQPMPSHMAD